MKGSSLSAFCQLKIKSKLFTQTSTVLLSALMLSACGGGGGGSDDNGGTTPITGNITVSGSIVIPDGTTPVSNATVYIASDQSSVNMRLQKPVVGTDCPEPEEAYILATCTDENGDFSLEGLAPAVYEVSVTKGAFRASFQVDVENESDDASITLTTPVALGGNIDAGAANIAVVTGQFDSMEDVLAKSGLGSVDFFGNLVLGSEAFDLYDGDDTLDSDYREFSELFEIDPSTGNPRINNYDIVFINCGANDYGFSDETFSVDPEDSEVQNIIFNYVNSGGRLYATDWAYDYIEQTFPEYIDFYGSESITDPFEPEYAHDAQEGISIDSESATILNDDLRTYLSNAECEDESTCLNSDGTLHVEGFLGAWAVMEGVHSMNSNVTIYTEGPAPTFSDDPEADPPIRPLMVSLSIGEGKVFFSSYHTESNFSTALLPQERALQFLVFE